jgi:hypothetical protein
MSMNHDLFSFYQSRRNWYTGFIQKRKSLGRHALITQLYYELKTKENLAGYFNLKAWKERIGKGADDDETTAPFPGSLVLK